MKCTNNIRGGFCSEVLSTFIASDAPHLRSTLVFMTWGIHIFYHSEQFLPNLS